MFAALNGDALDPCVIARAEAHHVRIIFERVVHDPAVVGVHRLQLHRPPRDPDRVGDLADPAAETIIPHRAPVRDVDLNFRRAAVLRLQNAVKQKLQVFQGFTVTTNQGVALGREHLQLTAILGFDLLDVGHKSQMPEHCIQDFFWFHKPLPGLVDYYR